MTTSTAKSLQQAEALFVRTAPPPTARDRAFEELDSIAVARDEKTVRLREARLAKEERDGVTSAARPLARKASARKTSTHKTPASKARKT